MQNLRNDYKKWNLVETAVQSQQDLQTSYETKILVCIPHENNKPRRSVCIAVMWLEEHTSCAYAYRIAKLLSNRCVMLTIGMLWHHKWCSRCNLKHKGSICDRDQMLWLQTHHLWLGTHICDWSHTYAYRVAYWYAICDCSHKNMTGSASGGLGCNCATKEPQVHKRNMLIRIAYIANHLGLISLFPLM
jgi:hypothetical protein